MKHRTTHRSLVFGLYLNAAVLAVIAIVMLARGGSPPILPAAMAQNQLPIGGGAGVFIVPAQFSSNTFGCYLMDIDAQTICAYQFFPPDHTLRLMAARNFRYDRRLGNYNTPNPTPAEVKDIYDLEQQAGRVLNSNTTPPSVEAPPKQD